MAMTLIMRLGTAPSSRRDQLPVEEQAAKLAVKLSRLLRVAAVAVVCDHQARGLLAEAFGLEALEQTIDDVMTVGPSLVLGRGAQLAHVGRRGSGASGGAGCSAGCSAGCGVGCAVCGGTVLA